MLGGAAGVVWLVLPVMTINAEVPVAATRAGPAAEQDTTAGQAADGTSAADLVLPLVAVGGAGVLAGYGYVRRTRRARTRTTPGVVSPGIPPVVSPRPPVTPLPVLERQAGASLVQADDCIRTSRAELSFAEARFGPAAVEPFHRALREAERELAAAFAIHLRYGRGVPEGRDEEAARRQALAGIVGRCAEAGRRLDAAAPEFDQLRALVREMGGALEVAEGRFRELTGRTGAVEATLADLHARYPASATATVTGYVEQAKDRLVFATTHLNQARQAADLGRSEQAVRDLRAAEGAVGQADTLLTDVDQLADSLAGAADLVPAALTGAEAVRARAATATADGVSRSLLGDTDAALAAVREELTSDRPYDPLAALRSIVRAVSALGGGQDGVLGAAAWLVGRGDVRAADGFVATHRGAVGAGARTLLAEAERLLGTDPATAAEPASAARELAEQDVRVHGNPYSGGAEHTSGAVLGGVLLGEDPDGGPPLTLGGPDTRKRERPNPGKPASHSARTD